MTIDYCQRNALPKVFKRFVDDIFVMFTNEFIRFLRPNIAALTFRGVFNLTVDLRLGSKHVSELYLYLRKIALLRFWKSKVHLLLKNLSHQFFVNLFLMMFQQFKVLLLTQYKFGLKVKKPPTTSFSQ